MKSAQRSKTGYTLIELLLSISLIGIIAAFSFPIFRTFQFSNDLESAVNYTVKAIRNAQFFSRGVDQDSTWGVYIQTQTITLFKGSTYATRDTTYDQIYDIASQIKISGLTEVVFTKVFGLPVQTMPASINYTSDNVTKIITINAKGALTY